MAATGLEIVFHVPVTHVKIALVGATGTSLVMFVTHASTGRLAFAATDLSHGE